MAMIYRQPGETGIGIKADDSAVLKNGNSCHCSSNERRIKMKLNSIIFCLCAGLCSSAVINDAFSMNELVVAKKGQLNNYCLYLASMHLKTDDDHANLVISSKRFQRNMEKFHYNPIELTENNACWFPNIKTLVLKHNDNVDSILDHLISSEPISNWRGHLEDTNHIYFDAAKNIIDYLNGNEEDAIQFRAFVGRIGANIIHENMLRDISDQEIENHILDLSKLYFMFSKYGDEFEGYLHENNGDLDNSVYRAFLREKLTILRHPSYITLADLVDGKCNKLNKLAYVNGAYTEEREVIPNTQDGTSCLGLEGRPPLRITRYGIQQLVARGENIQEIVDKYLPYVTSIDDYAFCGCQELTSIIIPNNIKSIGNGVFRECKNLKSVIIHNSVKYIDDCAFWGCRGLESITIPDSVLWIGSSVFGFTNATIEVPYKAMKEHIMTRNFINKDRIKVVEPVDRRSAWMWPDDGNIIIPNDVDSINLRMFVGREDIKSIVIPSSVRSFSQRAFRLCGAYKYVVQNDIIKDILIWAGVEKYKIVIQGRENQWWVPVDGKIIVPGDVEQIEANMFKYRQDISSVVIPNTVKLIGHSAFDECWACTFTVPNNEIKDMLIDSGVYEYRIAIQGEENQWWIPVGGKLIIPNSVERIEDYKFMARDDIISIEIPDSVTSIGKYAFSQSERLTSVTIPDSVKSIGDDAFYGCKLMSSITISDRLESIGVCAFCGCAALENVFVKCSGGVISNEKADEIKEVVRCGYCNPNKVHFINANGEEIQPTDE